MKQWSVACLHAASLCIGLFLFAPSAFSDDYKSAVTAKVLQKTTVTGNGQKISYPVTDRAEVTAMAVDLAPGAETGWHKHPVPVYAYVLSGNLEVELEGGRRLQFGPGDAVIEVVETFHNGKNTGSSPVKLVVFYLGVQETPIVVKRAPAESGRP